MNTYYAAMALASFIITLGLCALAVMFAPPKKDHDYIRVNYYNEQGQLQAFHVFDLNEFGNQIGLKNPLHGDMHFTLERNYKEETK